MAWFADKMAKWKRLINENAAADVDDYVLDGNEDLTGMTPQERANWSCRAMTRLEEVIPDLETRKKIMVGRSCVFAEEFGEEPLIRLREIYKRTGDLEAVFEAMADDREKHSRPYRGGETIVEVKAPCDPAAYAVAQTPEERRIASCFCPLAQAGVVASPAPEPHCYCGGGWYKGIWEFILERPVRVEVLRSVMHGDDDCAFAIHL